VLRPLLGSLPFPPGLAPGGPLLQQHGGKLGLRLPLELLLEQRVHHRLITRDDEGVRDRGNVTFTGNADPVVDVDHGGGAQQRGATADQGDNGCAHALEAGNGTGWQRGSVEQGGE
jgi:hypothetical protein